MYELLEYVSPLVAQVWPVIAPLVGVLIGALITSRQAARAELFRLREAKLQRLRAAFQPVLLTAWAFEAATSPGSTQPPDQEDAARSSMLGEAMTGLNQARVQLALETDASALNDTFQRLYAAYAVYALTRADTRAGNIPPEGQRLTDKRQSVVALVAQLEREMRDTLSRLELHGRDRDTRTRLPATR